MACGWLDPAVTSLRAVHTQQTHLFLVWGPRLISRAVSPIKESSWSRVLFSSAMLPYLQLLGLFFFFFSSAGSTQVNSCPASRFCSLWQKSRISWGILTAWNTQEKAQVTEGQWCWAMPVFQIGPWNIHPEVSGREGKQQRDLSDVGVTKVSHFSSK